MYISLVVCVVVVDIWIVDYDGWVAMQIERLVAAEVIMYGTEILISLL